MSETRKIRSVLKAKPTIEGAGVHLKRVFGFNEVPMFDPFLLLDDFRAAWRGGSGMKGTLLASFGIGLAIGMLVFASIGSPQAMAERSRNTATAGPNRSSYNSCGSGAKAMVSVLKLKKLVKMG